MGENNDSDVSALSDRQRRMLSLLRTFDRWCRERGFHYWLAGGSMLGAVRHGGFIPWDDDADVMMFRDEYDRMTEQLEKCPPPGTFWESAESRGHPATIHLHGKLCDADSPFESIRDRRFRFGIDVFPLDWVPESTWDRLVQRHFGSFYKHLLPLLFGGTSSRHRLLKGIVSALARPFFPRREKVVANYRRAVVCPRRSDFLYSASGRYGYWRERFPVTCFAQTVEMPFSGLTLPVPSGWKALLELPYGKDFMTVQRQTDDAVHYRPKADRVGLVLATRGRTREVANFLDSLRKRQDARVVVADQNEDGRLDPVLEAHSHGLDLEHVRLPPHGVCESRNRVLDRMIEPIVAFPDDDCTYSEDTLSRVLLFFAEHPTADVVVGGGRTRRPHRLGKFSVFRHGEMFLQFYRREAIDRIGLFDVDFGPGPKSRYPYGGDDSDYLFRAVSAGCSVWRDARIHVNHPPQSGEGFDFKKVRGYGRTRMMLLKKHKFPQWFAIANVAYPLVMILTHPSRARYFYAMLNGRLSGFLGRAGSTFVALLLVGCFLGTCRAEEVSVADGNASALRAALDKGRTATADAPLTVRVRSGAYEIDTPLAIYSHTRLLLESGAVVRASAGFTSANLLVARHMDGISVCPLSSECRHGGCSQFEDIAVEGGVWEHVGDPARNLVAFRFVHGHGLSIRNLMIRNCTSNFINLGATSDVLVEGVVFEDGVVPSSGSADNIETVRLQIASASGGKDLYPIDGTVCEDVRFFNCVFTNVFAGVGTRYYQPDEGHGEIRSAAISVSNCVFAALKGPAVRCWGMNDVVVSDCRAEGCMLVSASHATANICGNEVVNAPGAGIQSLGGSSVIVAGNVVVAAGETGIEIADAPSFDVHGNVVSDSMAHGIRCYRSSEGVVTSNRVIRAGSHGIFVSGTDAVPALCVRVCENESAASLFDVRFDSNCSDCTCLDNRCLAGGFSSASPLADYRPAAPGFVSVMQGVDGRTTVSWEGIVGVGEFEIQCASGVGFSNASAFVISADCCQHVFQVGEVPYPCHCRIRSRHFYAGRWHVSVWRSDDGSVQATGGDAIPEYVVGDVVALRSALERGCDATASVPLTVRVRPGTYEIDAPLTIHSHSRIFCESGARIVAVPTFDYTDMLLVRHFDESGNACPISPGCRHGGYSQFEDIVIEGGIWEQTGDPRKQSVVFRLVHGQDIVLRNLTCRKCTNHAINLSASRNVRMENVTLADSVAGTVIPADEGAAGSSESKYWGLEAVHLDIANASSEANSYPQDDTVCSNVFLSGCIFTNVFSGVGNHHVITNGFGDEVRSSGCVVSNCAFYSVSGWAAWSWGFDDFSICDCRMVDSAMAYAAYADNFRAIGNVMESPAHSGLSVRDSRNPVLESNRVSGTTDHGVVLGRILSGRVVRNRVCSSENALHVYGSVVEICENEIFDCRGSGVSVLGTDGASAVSIKSNEIVRTGSYGVFVTGKSSAVLLGNRVAMTGANAVHAIGSSRLTAEENIFEHPKGNGLFISDRAAVSASCNDVTDATAVGIEVNGSCNFTIFSNRVVSCGSHGIRAHQASDGVIAQNWVEGAGKHGIFVSGTEGIRSARIEVFGNRSSTSASDAFDVRFDANGSDCTSMDNRCLNRGFSCAAELSKYRPAAPEFNLVDHRSGGEVTVGWERLAGISGYELQVSRQESFADGDAISLAVSDVSYDKICPSDGSALYFRIRSIHRFNGLDVASSWSNVLDDKSYFVSFLDLPRPGVRVLQTWYCRSGKVYALPACLSQEKHLGWILTAKGTRKIFDAGICFFNLAEPGERVEFCRFGR